MTATPSRRTTTLTLYDGDDFERLAELRREADHATALSEKAEDEGVRRAGEDEADPELAADARAKQARYDAFVDEAAERATEVRLRAMRGKAFRALMAEHPPRDGNDMDAQYGVNTETFPLPLLVECLESPELTPSARQEFIEDLADGDYELWWVTAYWLNRGQGGDPKAGRYSTDSQSSDVT